jgi:hypothetical protein
VQQLRGLNLSLQAGAVESELHVFGPEIPQGADDAVAAQVGGIRHGRSPVAFHAARILVQQARVTQHQRADRIEIHCGLRIELSD